MKPGIPNILLINPWIHDFAAYDFWAKPTGLLYLGSMLRSHGFPVSYIDCLDRFHPRDASTNAPSRSGRGPYLKSPIPKPPGLQDIPRRYSRYGIPPPLFKESLLSQDKPDLILVTSFMTYWYPGVQETIRVIREVFPDTPIILGGIYASLCQNHARTHSGANAVISGPGEEQLSDIILEFTGYKTEGPINPDDLDSRPYPAYDLQSKITYVPLITSRGCPFSCAYCATAFLNPIRSQRDPESILEEIGYWHRDYGVEDYIFYDDALLVDADNHAIPLFEKILNAGLKVHFHTPNAVHIREITEDTARLMFAVGFKTLRLGLETGEFADRDEMDQKVTEAEFTGAAELLKSAGFQEDQIGAYLLVGLPGMSLRALEDSIHRVRQSGITPVLAYYTPIPHTEMWDQAVASSRYDLEADPIYTNNAILPCRQEPFSWKILSHLKDLTSR